MPELEAPTFDAFLSYASVDRRRVTRIQRYLERSLRSAGAKTASVYLDQTDIRGGNLTDELGRALLQSKALLVCCSAAAKDSHWVSAEVSKFMAAAPDRPVIPLLLDGTPGTAFPAGLPADLRYHDLRTGVWPGVMSPAARDELLRVAALLSGAELRELIDWDRRRLVMRGGAALVASVPIAGTGWWLYEQATVVRPADVSARMTLTWAIGEVENGERINDLLSPGKLRVNATTRRDGAPLAWPKRNPRGVIEMPELVLEADSSKNVMATRQTVDDTSFTSIRTFAPLSGVLGSLDRRSAWPQATFEAIVQVMAPELIRTPLVPDDDRLTRDQLRRSFDELYGITPAEREEWGNEDYAVTPLPIRATFELFLSHAPVWSAQGMAARVWEHDEDVSGKHVIYFRPARGTL